KPSTNVVQPGKRNAADELGPTSSTKTQQAPTEGATTERCPPLVRRIDWLSFALATVLVMAAYLYTLAPDLTLEDSGELAVASMYAGVPHPPGYPVWTLYTWLFTKILPFSNIAWRVSVSSAFAAAVACGLAGLLISRGSSMLLESIDWFKDI